MLCGGQNEAGYSATRSRLADRSGHTLRAGSRSYSAVRARVSCVATPMIPCPYCGVPVAVDDPYNSHVCVPGPKSGFALPQPPTEMASLTAIKAALARIEESQGKLLAALNETSG